MHIAIAGNIGSGKTTLTKKLAKHFNPKIYNLSGDIVGSKSIKLL